MDREDWAETSVLSFVEGGYFNTVIHEEDLNPIREEELTLDEILDLEVWCGKAEKNPKIEGRDREEN